MPPKKKTPAAAATATATATANGNGNGNGTTTTRQTRKRVASADVDDDASQQPQTKKKAKAAPKKTKPAEDDEPKAKVEEVAAAGKSNIATSKDLNIPLDEMCPNSNFKIYIDDNGIIFDANLNQTNSTANNNKFYRLQLIQSPNGQDFRTWSRWGRVGERGQSAMLGSGSLADAMSNFEKKFKDKSGLKWIDRDEKSKAGKYTFVEKSYADDSDAEDDAPAKVKSEEEKYEPPESQLHPAIQNLMELIFNPSYFANTMAELNYDVNKLPLGKLSKNTITKGFQALKDLSLLIADPSLAQSEYGTSFANAAEQLSNAFYSLIPHAFRRDRPPIITNTDMLKREVDLLDSLSDMKDAANIMKVDTKSAEKINALDQQFKGLNLDEMTPLPTDGSEYDELQKYLVNTRGQTHHTNYKVTNIFRIERKGEKARFDSAPFAGPPRDRRLLWHGSRATNFGGILSQGLRIAPPEAPVSGYMFGKGIYLADMSSKSANYCVAGISGGHALLLLCEAELGDPMQTLTNASYTAGEDAKAKGMLSTWGQGTTGPTIWKDGESIHPSLKGVKLPDTDKAKPGRTDVQNAYLQYNEYIAYDVAQVRLRYLFQVKMY